jgi:hypothetical protein
MKGTHQSRHEYATGAYTLKGACEDEKAKVWRERGHERPQFKYNNGEQEYLERFLVSIDFAPDNASNYPFYRENERELAEKRQTRDLGD